MTTAIPDPIDRSRPRSTTAPARMRSSSARGPSAPSESGLSLIEVLIVLLLMTLLTGIFYEILIASSRANMASESRNDLAVIGQRIVNQIQTEVLQAKLILQEDSVGTGYRTRLAAGLPAGVSEWTGSRMPLIDANTSILGPDPGPNNITNRTGNSLILVRQLQPVAIQYDHDGSAGTPMIDFMADRYEIQYYFLRQNTTSDFGGFGYYLELMQAKTQVFADYFQLNSLGALGTGVVQGLRTQSPPILLAWNPGLAINAPAFYTLNAAGTMSGTTTPSFSLTLTSLMKEFAGGRIAGKMGYSVALNASTPLALKDPVPLYATASSNFPGGMEFLVVGAPRSRKVVSRLVLASSYGGRFNSQESSVITSARGF